MKCRHQLVEIEVTTGAACDVINQVVTVMKGNDFGNRLTLQRDFKIRFVIDGDADNEILAAKSANPGDDFTRKAGTVFQ